MVILFCKKCLLCELAKNAVTKMAIVEEGKREIVWDKEIEPILDERNSVLAREKECQFSAVAFSRGKRTPPRGKTKCGGTEGMERGKGGKRTPNGDQPGQKQRPRASGHI